MLTDLDLADLHLRTLLIRDDAGRVVSVRNHPDQPVPKAVVASTRQGSLAWFRHDVDAATTEAVREAASAEPAWDGSDLEAGRYASLIDAEESFGRAYAFPTDVPMPDGVTTIGPRQGDVLEGGFDLLLSELRRGDPFDPVMAVVVDGKAVSICCTARLSDDAAQAGVETLEAHRGNSYAKAVTLGWGRAMRIRGTEPIYSHEGDNLASRAVALGAGLLPFCAGRWFS